MKNILVLIHDDAGQEARFQAALDLTRAVSGHLRCVDVAVIPMVIDDYVAAGGAALLLADERAREKANRTRMESRLANEDVRWDWIDVAGDTGSALRDTSQLADVVVVNRRLDDAIFPDMLGIAGELIVQGSAPVVAVPQSATGFAVTESAMVAWDGSREAEQALQAAVPLLALARAVTIVQVEDGTARVPAEEAARYLARHGIEPLVRLVPPVGGTAATLLDQVRGQGAAWLVMGGYGHGRLMEAVFGGVTRQLLCESPVPLFLAH